MRGLPFYSRTRKKREYPEAQLQAAIVQHLFFAGAFFHSVPNERQCSVKQHARLKANGLRKGVADLSITINGRTHYMECKARGEKQSEEQLAFEADCIEEGIPYACVDNIDAALKVLNAWGVKALRMAMEERERAVA